MDYDVNFSYKETSSYNQRVITIYLYLTSFKEFPSKHSRTSVLTEQKEFSWHFYSIISVYETLTYTKSLHSHSLSYEIKVHNYCYFDRDYSQNCHLECIHFGCPPRNISKCDFTGYLHYISHLMFKPHFQSVSVGAMYMQDLASVVCFVRPQRLGKQMRKSDFKKVPNYLEPFSNSYQSLE